MIRACSIAASVLILAGWTGNSPAAAQTFPNKAIRLLVGFPAGGPSDVPARIIAEKLRVSLGQPVVVENKTGAAGMIALNEMLAQPRDGHTLLLCSYIDPLNTLLYKKVAYKIDDIAWVSTIQKAYYAFAIPSALPANDLKEFIAHAKANPGKLNYGRVGVGSVTEILPKQLEKLTGIQMTGITFKGTGPALQEVVAGRLDFMVGPLLNTMPLYEGKKLKVVGITGPERLQQFPNIPTLKEQGVNIVNYGWWGVCAGSGTPKPIVDLLYKHVAAAVNSNEFLTGMTKAHVIPTASTPEAFVKIMTETTAEFATMIKELGIPQVD